MKEASSYTFLEAAKAKIINKKIFLVMAFYAIHTIPSQAALITVTDNLLDDMYLPESSTTSSLFYIANLLPSESYTLNSAYFEFNFSDQGDIVNNITSNPHGPSSSHVENVYTDNEREQVMLSIGSQALMGESTYTYEVISEQTQSESHCVPTIFNVCGGGVSHLHHEVVVEAGYNNFPTTISGYLGEQDLLNLDESGLVFWSLGMLDGGVFLDSATLTVDYSPVTTVPVPASFILMGMGLGGLGLFSRTRKTG